MATRSRICIENMDGSIDSIYCHWDGYPEGVGKTLTEHYTNPEEIRKLVGLGGISSLRDTLEETAKEAYKEDGVKYNDIGDLLNNLGRCGEEYTYIYMQDYTGAYRWNVVETPYPQDLESVLRKSGNND